MPRNLDGPEPMYRRIAAIVVGRIADGTCKPNTTVPPELEVCDEFGVSRRTARSAYAVLRDAGLGRRWPSRREGAPPLGGKLSRSLRSLRPIAAASVVAGPRRFPEGAWIHRRGPGAPPQTRPPPGG